MDTSSIVRIETPVSEGAPSVDGVKHIGIYCFAHRMMWLHHRYGAWSFGVELGKGSSKLAVFVRTSQLSTIGIACSIIAHIPKDMACIPGRENVGSLGNRRWASSVLDLDRAHSPRNRNQHVRTNKCNYGWRHLEASLALPQHIRALSTTAVLPAFAERLGALAYFPLPLLRSSRHIA